MFEAAACAGLAGLIFTCVEIATVESLRGMLARWNITSAIAGRDTLEIDNSALTADAVARRIATPLRAADGRRNPKGAA